MNPTPALVFTAMLFVTAARADEPSPPPAAAVAPAPAMSESECQVWNREISFAASVEKHDAQAFAEHLHPGAVFLGGTNKPRRGSEAIAAAWTDIVAGKD